MADVSMLFHNPESFSDSELTSMRNTIRMQRITPWLFTGALGAAGFLFNKGLPCWRQRLVMTAPFAVAGFVLGSTMSYKIGSGSLKANDNREILQAFETQYAQKCLNAAGYGSNALNLATHLKVDSGHYTKVY